MENVNKEVKKEKEMMASKEEEGGAKVEKEVKWKVKKRKMAKKGMGGRRWKASREELEIVI